MSFGVAPHGRRRRLAPDPGPIRVGSAGNPQSTGGGHGWRAANDLSIGQISLLDDPLLREPLRAEHVKPRLLGHWGTTPGLNLLYAHLNRLIVHDDLEALFVTGPGHGAFDNPDLLVLCVVG